MDDIEDALNTFRGEVTTASQAFFVWKHINNIAASDRSIHQGINANALSWNIITHSLQITFFITLGRLFDIDKDAFSVHSFLRLCVQHIDQFSRDALRERKIHASSGELDWLDDYIDASYQPVEMDFQRLRGELTKKHKLYESIYRPIRNKVLAHKEANAMEYVDKLFAKTSVNDIEEFLCFLFQITEIVFDLLHNGKLNPIGHYNFREEEFVTADIGHLLNRLRINNSYGQE